MGAGHGGALSRLVTQKLQGELMKSMLKFLASQIDVDTYQRLLVYSIFKKHFKEIKSAKNFDNREQLWDWCIGMCGGADSEVTFVEFGVHKGYSIQYFAKNNINSNSAFIGLDSFEGLPERWASYPKGFFDTGGKFPNVADARISFIKGWFQNTYIQLRQRLSTAEKLIVHYDADLYSSTLFALCKIDDLQKGYFAIFDEFTGHEARALYDYIQSHNASVSFLGKVPSTGYPIQVLCEIFPNRPQGL
jgi:hypothetical protein